MVISEIWLKLYLGLAKVLVAVNRKRRSPEVYLKALSRILNFAVAISVIYKTAQSKDLKFTSAVQALHAPRST